MTVRSRGDSRHTRGPDRAPPPDRTTYRVVYTVRGEPGVRREEVTVVPGYSRESDIPRILAARLAPESFDVRPEIIVLELCEL
ncbi:hypothetical protein [Kitasatospora sp. SUK 42]|uniref:hypothetical protein n=1 Tax=Kitasatospora sp. SUK 42 TaxID=1588882 RepID=UPI0018CA232E|nr:hypothetical protein [Kitasatospora sp. SUK 42]MBV2155259.1 hypothetical protein [Kitasatospora sp. SUK 42]